MGSISSPQQAGTANASLAEILQDDECRAILQEQQQKASEARSDVASNLSLDDMLEEFLTANPASPRLLRF